MLKLTGLDDGVFTNASLSVHWLWLYESQTLLAVMLRYYFTTNARSEDANSLRTVPVLAMTNMTSCTGFSDHTLSEWTHSLSITTIAPNSVTDLVSLPRCRNVATQGLILSCVCHLNLSFYQR